jgi:hypothetical protein
LHILILIDRMGCLLQYIGVFTDIRVGRVNDMRGVIGVRKPTKQNGIRLNYVCVANASAFDERLLLAEDKRHWIA